MLERGERLDIVEWFAAVTGVIGCGLVALNIDFSKYGWLFYGVSEAALMLWAFKRKAIGLFIMQSIYLLLTFVALYQWFGSK